MEQDTISSCGSKLQRDYILHNFHLLTPEAVGDNTLAIKTDHIGPWKTETKEILYSLNNSAVKSHGCACLLHHVELVGGGVGDCPVPLKQSRPTSAMYSK